MESHHLSNKGLKSEKATVRNDDYKPQVRENGKALKRENGKATVCGYSNKNDNCR